jgi:photosystem II stability/assembly factor-like uncharacterized protein
MLSIFTQFIRGAAARPAASLGALGLALLIGLAPAAKAEEAQNAAQSTAQGQDVVEYATPSKLATKDLLLAATKAGNRLVAVGEFGHVIYSDDMGVTWVQAASVPTQVTLTSVYFVNDKIGYAGGHDSTVLRTDDGGDHWTLSYHDVKAQAPIMSVYFENENHGFAMGAFSFVIETQDGGKTWTQRSLIAGSQEDSHLNQVFATKAGTILVAAEFGTVYRSTDQGKTFAEVKTGYEGSFWGGLALSDGAALIFGMRGNVYRSTDEGATWTKVNSGTDKSIGGGVELPNGTIVLAGLQGYVGYSTDHGMNFTEVVRADRLGYVDVSEGPKGEIAVYGEPGVKLQPDTPVEAEKEVGFHFTSGS